MILNGHVIDKSIRNLLETDKLKHFIGKLLLQFSYIVLIVLLSM